MKTWHPFEESIHLHVRGRISPEDAARQEATAREILQRLARQPGLVLADEVGMGKTFVALAVAASVALSDRRCRPVVVMVPPSLHQKWPRDFDVFRSKCLDEKPRQRLTATSADRGIEFLKLLDDPPERRKSIIFLTHGALHRGLGKGSSGAWVKLALIKRAIHRRRNIGPLKALLERRLGEMLEMGAIHRRHPEIWGELLRAPYEEWLEILLRRGINPGGDRGLPDDPVPDALARVLDRFDSAWFTPVWDALNEIPIRETTNYGDRLAEARAAINRALAELWRECLRNLDLRLPLLIMDEAHHLKNARTRLASLFLAPEASDDAEDMSRGALGGAFERMLFLTATPFQLGHHELCSVLDRFEGIAWKTAAAPACGRNGFGHAVKELRQALDAAQQAALNLDAAWGSLRPEDLTADGKIFINPTAWWEVAPDAGELGAPGQRVADSFRRASERMRAAEGALRPWVIRHLRPREHRGRPRRKKLPGRSILNDTPVEDGLEVGSETLLPFLLAARATICAPDSRPVFAEGLASSFEAFLHTRKAPHEASDLDDEANEWKADPDRASRWYLDQLEDTLRRDVHRSLIAHPKVEATARRTLAAWNDGEKVLVFCHYIATGRVLRQVISELMLEEIKQIGADKLGCPPTEVLKRLETLGRRFFDTDSPARKAVDARAGRLLESFDDLREYRERLLNVVRRYLRTPSFLARYFPIERTRLGEDAVEAAFAASDGSGLTLREVLRNFFEFLQSQCGAEERKRCLEEIESVQTGGIMGREADATFAEDERQEAIFAKDKGQEPASAFLLPNVRLVNGSTKQETRQRLMLTFNSPFFPEVLVASSVMAEGVDLHRFCRYVIHHDLCWNPSTLEQRTGRVDRIGAKVEQCGQPIHLYLPYLAGTQDEKLYRVVMDRDRWFSVVMGEKFAVDTRTTDRLAQRLPLPEALARELAFRLEVTGQSASLAARGDPPLQATRGVLALAR